MPTNVTQKDKTLQAVIDYCQPRLAEAEDSNNPSAWNAGRANALKDVIDYCKDMLGYSGSIQVLTAKIAELVAGSERTVENVD